METIEQDETLEKAIFEEIKADPARSPEQTPAPAPELPGMPEATPATPVTVKFEEIPAQPVTAAELLDSENTVRRGRGRHPKDCKCVKCETRRNSGSDGNSSITTPGAEDIPSGPNYQAMSEIMFDCSTHSLAMLLGDEWKPRNPDERTGVCQPLAVYLKSKGCQDIPPGAMLMLVVCAYTAPRLKAPSTSEKIKTGWLWIKSKFSRKNKLQVK